MSYGNEAFSRRNEGKPNDTMPLFGIASGAALEHFAGGDVADHLLGVELIAVDAGQPHTARPRAERHVGVGRSGPVRDRRAPGPGSPAPIRRGTPSRFGRSTVSSSLHVTPGIEKTKTRRIGGGSVAADAGARAASTPAPTSDSTSNAMNRFTPNPARPRSSNARNGAHACDDTTERHELRREVGDEQDDRDDDARRRRGLEDDGETEDRAEHVRAGVAEHEVLAKVVGQQRQSGARDDGRRHTGRAGTADEDDRHVAEHRELGRSAGRAVEQVRRDWPRAR